MCSHHNSVFINSDSYLAQGSTISALGAENPTDLTSYSIASMAFQNPPENTKYQNMSTPDDINHKLQHGMLSISKEQHNKDREKPRSISTKIPPRYQLCSIHEQDGSFLTLSRQYTREVDQLIEQYSICIPVKLTNLHTTWS